MLRGDVRLQTTRWRVSLGRAPSGVPVSVPVSQINLIVAGGTGSGKSFATGLIAEQLVQLGYVVCVLDPEGDHAPLANLPSVVTLGGRDRLPVAEDVARVFEQSGTSVVIDLSLVTPQAREEWMRHALPFLERRRAEVGVPHWLIIDEAHVPLGKGRGAHCFSSQWKGHCIVTYQTEQLAELVLEDVDYVLLVAGKHGIDPRRTSAVCCALGVSTEVLRPHLDGIGFGEALLVRGGRRP